MEIAGRCSEVAPDRGTTYKPSWVFVFKAYDWDEFVKRQFDRFCASVGSADVFISMDETNGTKAVDWARVVPTSNAALVASGLADRFEKGSLIWWNSDYPHHDFFARFPTYDYYVFVEYDVVIQADVGLLVRQIEALGADFVAAPLKVPLSHWFWTEMHCTTYPRAEIRGTLNSLTVLSRRAMALLRDRRLAMSLQRDVPYWPIGELFMATEIARAGYSYVPLDEFGDLASYESFPPLLEEDLPSLRAHAFLHPVLDCRRYQRSLLRSGAKLGDYIFPRSYLRRSLARFPRSEYMPLLPRAAWCRFRELLADRARLAVTRISNGLRARLRPPHVLRAEGRGVLSGSQASHHL